MNRVQFAFEGIARRDIQETRWIGGRRSNAASRRALKRATSKARRHLVRALIRAGI